MASPKVGRLTRGEGRKVKMLSKDELLGLARKEKCKDRKKAIVELERRGIKR